MRAKEILSQTDGRKPAKPATTKEMLLDIYEEKGRQQKVTKVKFVYPFYRK